MATTKMKMVRVSKTALAVIVNLVTKYRKQSTNHTLEQLEALLTYRCKSVVG